MKHYKIIDRAGNVVAHTSTSKPIQQNRFVTWNWVTRYVVPHRNDYSLRLPREAAFVEVTVEQFTRLAKAA